jgi:predicted small lipoprotein YifL
MSAARRARALACLVLPLAGAILLSGCGRKGPLEGPPGTHLPRDARPKPAAGSLPETPVAHATPLGAAIPPKQPFILDPLIR